MIILKTYLITGGAGFIGSNFVKYMLKKYGQSIKLVVLDALTYAGNLGTLKDELNKIEFVKGDIGDSELVGSLFTKHNFDYVINFAAESHVDRSIDNPRIFLETNILGMQNVLETARKHWIIGKDNKGQPLYREGVKFLQISTDEVYGSLKKDFEEGKIHPDFGLVYGEKFFTEQMNLDARSPYSASKASADMVVKAYGETYKMSVNITRCSNNYGPYHFPEKLIPLMIKNVLEGRNLPVYGEGKNVRDWLYVEDHVKAIDLVLHKGRIGEVYNVGGHNERENIFIVKTIIDTIKKLMDENPKYKKVLKTDISNVNYDLITYVQDRLGHDMRYAIDPSKITKELGWKPETNFEEGIKKTIVWYFDNQEWVEEVTSGDYQKYYEKMYGKVE